MTRPAWETLSAEQQRAEWERWNAWQQQLSTASGPSSAHHVPQQRGEAWSPLAASIQVTPGDRTPTPSAAGKNRSADFGLIAGLVGLVVAPFILGPIALIYGGMGFEYSKMNYNVGRGSSIAAIVLGAVNLLLVVVWIRVLA